MLKLFIGCAITAWTFFVIFLSVVTSPLLLAFFGFERYISGLYGCAYFWINQMEKHGIFDKEEADHYRKELEEP